MYTNHNFTTHYVFATTPAPTKSCVDFSALLQAYTADDGWKRFVEDIFADVARFMYWTAVQRAQLTGNRTFFEQNRYSCLEKPEYVQNRINSALLKVMRHCCTLNCAVSRNGYTRFLTRCFSRTDDGAYFLEDAQELALSIAQAYYEATGKSINETRWLPY